MAWTYYRSCKCGNVSVDGGSWYVKRGFVPGARYRDIIVRYADAILKGEE